MLKESELHMFLDLKFYEFWQQSAFKTARFFLDLGEDYFDTCLGPRQNSKLEDLRL